MPKTVHYVALKVQQHAARSVEIGYKLMTLIAQSQGTRRALN